MQKNLQSYSIKLNLTEFYQLSCAICGHEEYCVIFFFFFFFQALKYLVFLLLWQMMNSSIYDLPRLLISMKAQIIFTCNSKHIKIEGYVKGNGKSCSIYFHLDGFIWIAGQIIRHINGKQNYIRACFMHKWKKLHSYIYYVPISLFH